MARLSGLEPLTTGLEGRYRMYPLMAVIVQGRPYRAISNSLEFPLPPPQSAKHRPLGYKLATQ